MSVKIARLGYCRHIYLIKYLLWVGPAPPPSHAYKKCPSDGFRCHDTQGDMSPCGTLFLQRRVREERLNSKFASGNLATLGWDHTSKRRVELPWVERIISPFSRIQKYSCCRPLSTCGSFDIGEKERDILIRTRCRSKLWATFC